MDPLKVLALVHQMNGELGRVLLVGCEPEYLGGPEGHLGVSELVQAALPTAVELIESLVNTELAGCHP